MIKLLGVVPTKRAEFDEQGEQVSPAAYDDPAYCAMSTSPVDGLTATDKPEVASVFAGVKPYYYAFGSEQKAATALRLEEDNHAD